MPLANSGLGNFSAEAIPKACPGPAHDSDSLTNRASTCNCFPSPGALALSVDAAVSWRTACRRPGLALCRPSRQCSDGFRPSERGLPKRDRRLGGRTATSRSQHLDQAGRTVAQTGIKRFFDYDLVKLTVNEKIRRIGNQGRWRWLLANDQCPRRKCLVIALRIGEDSSPNCIPGEGERWTEM
jgi:hypothetical protein